LAGHSHVVVGAGALGSAAAYWLTRSGVADVVVLEQYQLGHDRGASEDHSRLIRHAYHSSVYTALTQAAYDAWAEIEGETGLRLVLKTGGLDLAVAGTAGEAELANYRRSLTPFGIRSEDLDAAEVRCRWPAWRVDDDVVGLYQEDAGILDIRRGNAAHVALARLGGAQFWPGVTVRGIAHRARGVTLVTDNGAIDADHVVLCVASWLPALLGDLGLHWRITLSQEQVSYFATPNVRDFAPDRFPVWIWHGEPLFYGFPVYGEAAVKAARGMTGRFVTQETRSFEPDPSETDRIASFLSQWLPGAAGPELYSKTCVYDMPPDRDFIIDHVPGHPRVTVGIGAGHAAKFASLLGRILADLATSGTTAYPVGAFRADRAALTDPRFEPVFRMTGPHLSA
jgi:monomeric sarcosine oxidase